MAEPTEPARPILFASYPDSGLLNPLLVLAGELARRGVPGLVFATDEHRRADIENLSATSEVEFLSLGEEVAGLSPTGWDDETYRAVMNENSRIRSFQAFLRQSQDPHAMVAKYQLLEQAVERTRPALMVLDAFCGYAVDLALTKRIPFVLGIPFLASNMVSAAGPGGRSFTPRGFPTPRSGLPLRMNLRQRITNRLFRLRTMATFASPAMLRRMRYEDAVWAEIDVTRSLRNPMDKLERAELALCYSIAELDYPFAVPDWLRLTGPMIPPLPQAPPDPELTAWLDAHESIVYQAFGTLIRFSRDEVEALVEVARRLDGHHHVLWKLPASQQHLLPPRDELPPNLRVESWLPSQLDVLAHPNVRLFFNHTGSNSFHEGLYFGKPQVMWPLFVDCYDVAVRGEDHGIGLRLDRTDTVEPDDATDKLTRVLADPSYQERAERMAALMSTAGGRHAAADLLLELPVLDGSGQGTRMP
ncbi:glycosyltransferase [Saccharopolyspora sp. NFXS83]|uniref:glycosyltransferase n=1 Tax=Saccharopolyspora sp. NFXS83 TaxID=2993560 RepID=UPI00224A71D5|nr:glycosyltransferase [Saccharopolyspora sp. NFXS83]MCX2731057.1 glycosyltransferase [Saccharopolyspora sp. NFXS83]